MVQIISLFFQNNKLKFIVLIFFCFLFVSKLSGQNIDPDTLLNKLDRIERNISDLQNEETERNLNSGYISRNEKRFDELETNSQENFGKIEELEYKLDEINDKIKIFSQSLDIRSQELSEEISKIKNLLINKDAEIDNLDNKTEIPEISSNNFEKNNDNYLEENTETFDKKDVKTKYENAIKLLWSNEYDDALNELVELRKINPKDLMPNIQYWLGEVYYAKKDFNQAVIEFGAGLKDYPESIKGPDNMLKLGLSFSNMKKNFEACSVFIELQIKYPDASKNVLQRAEKEKKKINCTDE